MSDTKAEREKLERLTVAELEEGLELGKWGPDTAPIARSILERRKTQESLALNQQGVDAATALVEQTAKLVAATTTLARATMALVIATLILVVVAYFR